MPSARAGDPALHTEVMFSIVGRRELVPPRVYELAQDLGFALHRVDTPLSLSGLTQLLKRRPISFLVGQAAPDMMSLVDSTGIAAVHFPPLLLVHHEPVPDRMREKMRRAGVAALVDANAPAEVMAGVVAKLARSWSWVRIPLGRLDVAGAIQSLADLGESLLLTVACPHVPPLMTEPWSLLRPCSHGDACRGWFGRIYIRNGIITSAETPEEQGIPALAQMLELKAGHVFCHEFLLSPGSANVELRVNSALLEAATCSDHLAVGIPPSAETLGPVADSHKSARSGLPVDDADELALEMPSPTLVDELLQAEGTLRGVAACDDRGWVESLAGTIDAETLCAVVTMSSSQMQRAAALLGMGPLQQWAVGGDKAALYATITETGAIAAVGDPSLNLASALRTTKQLLRDVF